MRSDRAKGARGLPTGEASPREDASDASGCGSRLRQGWYGSAGLGTKRLPWGGHRSVTNGLYPPHHDRANETPQNALKISLRPPRAAANSQAEPRIEATPGRGNEG
ncbi:hypothetical protein Acor_57080 [Acrocarpospora corrugata]|uniref:Uncharacterized protein n=1 Tax=Acrocarpospora corrugata TaxID=35763 RepID=A0A5M3W6S9_9ACTN|nr:hypothetical protein Acor_57080 [Acrocarpospora corrugata]